MQIPSLAINVALDKTGPIPVIRIFDVSPYGGLQTGITGIVSIKQPDQVVVAGNFSYPDIYYNGTILVNAQKELRLATNGAFQNGTYVISYTARRAGYDDTTISQSFDMNYSRPKGVLAATIDVFTPSLKVNDITDYVQATYTLQSTVRSWASASTPGNTGGGNTVQFDLNILGKYYDALYTVSLNSIVTYLLTAASNVSVIDSFEVDTQLTTSIPRSLNSLFALINNYKVNMNKGCSCKEDYFAKKSDFAYAFALFQDFLYRGTCGDRSGLLDVYNEILSIVNKNFSPVYTPTNAVISTYNFGGFCGIGAVAIPLIITQQPIAQSVAAGSPAPFTVAASGQGPLTYQWRKNASPIPGATNSAYIIANAQIGDQATYDCIVSDALGNSIPSNTANLTIVAAIVQFTAKWGWFDTDPFTALQTSDTLVYQGSGLFNNGSSVIADFKAAPNLKFLLMREPSSQPVKTVYNNGPLINGNLPNDPAIRDPFVANGFRYYLTRDLSTFDPNNVTAFS